jgi:hypothetical protein
MQTFFATIFAGLLAMGATLLPAYQCVCGDGSVSMQLAQPFCNSEHGVSQATSGGTLQVPGCAGLGCESQRVGEDLVVQPTTEHRTALDLTAPAPAHAFLAVLERSIRGSMAHQLSQSRGDPDPVLLRSVILLV